VVSKWVGESAKNIESIFTEARAVDAIIVFDEAEALFGNRSTDSSAADRYANMDVGLLLVRDGERRWRPVVITGTGRRTISGSRPQADDDLVIFGSTTSRATAASSS
jgi:SpoVK/Ycf46/Vps4 family AAA+-type ATPase